MYHYVREFDSNLPFFVYLDVLNFEKQLKWFVEKFNVLSEKDYRSALKNKIAPNNSIVLTFDDGLSDHYKYVFPILKKMNLWGIFFVSSEPFEKRNLLNVHKIHYLLGKYGSDEILKILNEFISKDFFVEDFNSKFDKTTYTKQKANQSTSDVKRIINYYIQPKYKNKVLNNLFEYFKESEEIVSSAFYLNKEQINEMIDAGMAIGSHAHSHNLLANLDAKEQEFEIKKSFEVLNSVTRDRVFSSFCYPYGGSNSYDENTINILSNENIESAFVVESRDVNCLDLSCSKYKLPRFDCNEFPFGAASGLNS